MHHEISHDDCHRMNAFFSLGRPSHKEKLTKTRKSWHFADDDAHWIEFFPPSEDVPGNL